MCALQLPHSTVSQCLELQRFRKRQGGRRRSMAPAVPLKAGCSEEFWKHGRAGMEMQLGCPQTGAKDLSGLPILSKTSKYALKIDYGAEEARLTI